MGDSILCPKGMRRTFRVVDGLTPIRKIIEAFLVLSGLGHQLPAF